MSYLLGLPGALERFGLPVEVVPRWETRSAGSLNALGSVGHHTAGPRAGDRPSLNVCVNGRPDLTGPLCNTYTDRFGAAVVVAAGRANHAGAGGYRGLVGNSSVAGHEAESPGIEPAAWTPEHLHAYPRVHAAHLWLIGRDASWYCGHKTWTTRKIDPVTILDEALRVNIALLLAAGRDTDVPVLAPPPALPPVPAPPWPLPRGSYFGPRTGPGSSVSGYYSHRADLRAWQDRMLGRGWAITPDGLYGDQTARITRLFQAEKRLTVDGLVGPATWSAAWSLLVT